MKKITYLILILAAAFGIIYLFNKTSSVSNNGSTSTDINVSHPDPSNATFLFDDGPVTLKQGSNQAPIVPGGATVIETNLSDIIGYGDINKDNKNDAVVVLIQDGGGSGVFAYLAGFVSGPLDYKGTNTIFIGDRIIPQSVEIRDGLITLKYLDRRPTEAFADEPTILTTKQFTYSNGMLVEK